MEAVANPDNALHSESLAALERETLLLVFPYKAGQLRKELAKKKRQDTGESKK